MVARFDGCPIQFGDDFTRQRYVRAVEQAWRAQTVRYAVAPLQRVPLPDGRSLEPGDEVTETMLAGGSEHPHVALQRLVRRGVVLERDDIVEVGEPDEPAAA